MEKVNYYVQSGVSERFKRKPLREQARTLLANRNYCGRLVLEVKEPIALDEQNSCFHKDGTIGTLTTDGSSPKHNNRVIEPNTRIRKLTEKECFRLMGVKDEDFDKIAKNQSASSLYHLAGDSIVVNVLMAIFKQML